MLPQGGQLLRGHLCIYYIIVLDFYSAFFTAYIVIDTSEDAQDVLASKNAGRNNLTYKQSDRRLNINCYCM